MTKYKLNELFEKSQEIINMMEVLGIQKYHGYSILKTAVGNFLLFDEIPITPYLADTYPENNLNNFIPKTSINIMEKFEKDIENKVFFDLYNLYALFIEKC